MEKSELIKILIKSIDLLAINDDDIMKNSVSKFPFENAKNKPTDLEKILNRELHEVCINHRLAFYLETELRNLNINEFCVDLEYNKNFKNSKIVKLQDGDKPVRPDIVIHKRMEGDISDRHLLIIEAKKGKSSAHDIDKVKSFMNDPRFLYKYGLTISYTSNQQKIIGRLYYKELNKIKEQELIINRKIFR